MSKVSNFIAAIRNLKNSWEYNFNKTKRSYRLLNFITRPYPINLKIDKDSFHVFKEIFIEDFYEYRKIKKYIPQNAVIIDIGANIGFFTFFILSKKPNAKVYLFEPFPENINFIKKTIEANHQLENKMIISSNAVTENNGQIIPFYVSDNVEQTAVASIYKNFDTRNSKKIDVQTTNLESIFIKNNLNKIDVLKLDCEGSEFPILYSAPIPLLMKIKLILIEVHNLDSENNNNTELVSYLKKNGFITQSKIYSNNCHYTFAINPENV